MTFAKEHAWLPHGRVGAVCFSIDDIHPGSSTNGYDGGGDLEQGVLGRLSELVNRHPNLRTTLFVTADWRCLSPRPTRSTLAAIPLVRENFYLAPVRATDDLRLSRHPEFVDYLRRLPRTEIAFHGLHHVAKGRAMSEEFGRLSRRDCEDRLRRMKSEFERVKLATEPGFCPPGWAAPPNLIRAMNEQGFRFLSAGRDLETPIAPKAVTAGSGLRGVSLVSPQPIANASLLHFSVNFQATSEVDRALRIIELGGLVHVKAHAVKKAFDYIALDGLDERYRDFLHALFERIAREFDEGVWWTSMGEVTRSWPLAN